MAKQTVREIEARLARDIEDKVLQRLGYRETEVLLPGGEPIDPRPPVLELTPQQSNRRFGEQVLKELSGAYRPAIIWEVRIPRTYAPEQVRVEGTWEVKPDGENGTVCIPLSIQRGDSRWVVYLTPQRRPGTLI